MEEMDALLTRLSLAGIDFSLLIREAMMNVDIRCFSSCDPDPFFQDRPLVFLENERGGVKTISAPHMIVTMLHHLELNPGMEVMIIGAKGGYISALVNEIVGDDGGVTLLDYDLDVLNHARDSHKISGYANFIHRRKLRRDGRSPANLPSELSRVLVTGAIDSLPSWVESRVKEGGFAVFPNGGRFNQNLIKREKQGGNFIDTDLGNVVFGPLDIKDSEPMVPSPFELADILEEVSVIAKDLDLMTLEDSIKLDDLLAELRSLPDDLPPFNLDYAHEMPNEMINLLEKSANWMKQLWPLFLMLSEVNIQQPGALSDDDDYNFGPHEDMIP
jgi:protein-L-isoaspartate O-methyltransferase